MNSRKPAYHGYRFRSEIISHAVWLYYRFSLSFRDVEDLLAKRGIVVSYETIRQWCGKFGPGYVAKLKRRHGRLVSTAIETRAKMLKNAKRPQKRSLMQGTKPWMWSSRKSGLQSHRFSS